MWTCVICGSNQQPTCSLPDYKRYAKKFLRRPVKNAKTCSDVCRHERERRRKKAAREQANAARETVSN